MRLYPHQEEVLNATRGMWYVAYFMEQGLGKTFVGSEKMMEIGNGVNLLICQNSKINDWSIHFKTHYSGKVFVIDYTKPKSKVLKAEDIVLYSGVMPVVVIVNYELAWRRTELSRLTEFTLILDESSLIQNANAKQTKFIIRKLRHNAVILLSGTPCGGKFENLWTQSYLLGCGLTKREFEERFINFETIRKNGMHIRIVNRKHPYKNIEELKAILRRNGAVFMKSEDVLTLPEQRTIFLNSPIQPAYRKFLKDRYIEVEGKEMVGSSSLSFRLGLRMLASQYSKAKIESFRDLLNSTSDRLIVFYNFKEELRKLAEVCEKADRPMSFVNGEVKDLTEYEESDNSVTFCQYQAGSMGLNLQKANKTVYFSLPERSDLFEQSKKRIHRIGQKNACTYYIMQTASSIDQLIYRALEKKRDYTDELFREQYMD